jgi:hypothetical protein
VAGKQKPTKQAGTETPFQRFQRLTKRLIAVPKEQAQKAKRGRRRA